jgi:hypothetical protein
MRATLAHTKENERTTKRRRIKKKKRGWYRVVALYYKRDPLDNHLLVVVVNIPQEKKKRISYLSLTDINPRESVPWECCRDEGGIFLLSRFANAAHSYSPF